MNEGVIRVTASEKAELTASRARLHVRVEGETFVLGNAALTRSREVAELVGKLIELGLRDEAVQVASVYTKTQSGLLTKSSRSMFGLIIEVNEMASLPGYLGVLASQKNVEMERLEWVYEEDPLLLELSTKAMVKAQAKAQAMAGAIGYSVSGIRSCSDSSEMPVSQDLFFHQQPVSRSRVQAQSAPMELGTEFKASKTIGVTVAVEFTLTKEAG